MNIEGTHTINAPRDRVFQALTDPAVLQKCIPGCKELEKTAENQYSAKLSAGVGSIKAVFTATVTIEDVVSPSHYKLVVEGKGQPGFVKGSGTLDLDEKKDMDEKNDGQGGGTEIKYAGDVNVGGMLASVGQRMLQATAKMMAGRFFKTLGVEAGAVEEDGLAEETGAPVSSAEPGASGPSK